MLADIVAGAANSTYYRLVALTESDGFELRLVALDHGATELDPIVAALRTALAGVTGVVSASASRETGATTPIS